MSARAKDEGGEAYLVDELRILGIVYVSRERDVVDGPAKWKVISGMFFRGGRGETNNRLGILAPPFKAGISWGSFIIVYRIEHRQHLLAGESCGTSSLLPLLLRHCNL